MITDWCWWVRVFSARVECSKHCTPLFILHSFIIFFYCYLLFIICCLSSIESFLCIIAIANSAIAAFIIITHAIGDIVLFPAFTRLCKPQKTWECVGGGGERRWFLCFSFSVEWHYSFSRPNHGWCDFQTLSPLLEWLQGMIGVHHTIVVVFTNSNDESNDEWVTLSRDQTFMLQSSYSLSFSCIASSIGFHECDDDDCANSCNDWWVHAMVLLNRFMKKALLVSNVMYYSVNRMNHSSPSRTISRHSMIHRWCRQCVRVNGSWIRSFVDGVGVRERLDSTISYSPHSLRPVKPFPLYEEMASIKL